MSRLALLAAVLVAAYYFFQYSPFRGNLHFDGDIYSYVKEQRGGDLTNHFYARDGETFTTATTLIQIIEFGDPYPRGEWLQGLSPLINAYQLKPIRKEAFEFAGSVEKAGQFFESYAAPIVVKGEDHMAFLVITLGEQPERKSKSQKLEIISKLKGIEQDLN